MPFITPSPAIEPSIGQTCPEKMHCLSQKKATVQNKDRKRRCITCGLEKVLLKLKADANATPSNGGFVRTGAIGTVTHFSTGYAPFPP
jgi:hypothetical protein